MSEKEQSKTSGGCLCGNVRFEVSSFASGVFKCHCSKCRKAFGGASSAAVLVPEQAFTWLTAHDTQREFQTPSGFMRRFCGDCGSILPQHLPDFQMQWVPAGLLEGELPLQLKQHIHVASKANWEILDDQTRHLEQGFD
ncbi:MAG: GFA family protein [Halioglobus sp.]